VVVAAPLNSFMLHTARCKFYLFTYYDYDEYSNNCTHCISKVIPEVHVKHLANNRSARCFGFSGDLYSGVLDINPITQRSGEHVSRYYDGYDIAGIPVL